MHRTNGTSVENRREYFAYMCIFKYNHHHHPTQCIPLIEKLWTGSEEGRTAATHTHKGVRDQRSPPARER